MNVLTPNVADITVEGLSWSGILPSEDLGLTDADVPLRGTVAVQFHLRTMERTIDVLGAVKGTAIRQCVRCLSYFDDSLAVSLHVVYERAPTGTAVPKRGGARRKRTISPANGEEDRSDDRHYFTGDHLELALMLREQLILAAPMQPLCSQECRGLCLGCGQNLNEGRCRCNEEATQSPFQILRTLQNKLRDPRKR
ncbi:MAG: YceD family protein [Nitrospira sp.]